MLIWFHDILIFYIDDYYGSLSVPRQYHVILISADDISWQISTISLILKANI